MIKINKSSPSPKKLTDKGASKTANIIALYTANPKKYRKKRDPIKFEFDSKIYGHSTVKNQLKKDQNNKCCFCETADVDVIAHGDVEHFRPKGGYKQKNEDKLTYPGYYWLAYEWSNLFFSCQICNQRFKKNLFPLVDTDKRTIDHTHPLESNSTTLLVHPSFEDPENEIGFRKEIPYPKTKKGKQSIIAFGLDRERLNEFRRKHLDIVKSHIVLKRVNLNQFTADEQKEIMNEIGAKSIDELKEILEEAINFCNFAATKNAPYTSMVRNNFITLPQE